MQFILSDDKFSVDCLKTKVVHDDPSQISVFVPPLFGIADQRRVDWIFALS